ncbi:MAG: hypothetical protein IKY98_05140 [Alphaproteobacteria bacterium]|nr:hypothetical protein [Alphaproteobacteria bacterium]
MKTNNLWILSGFLTVACLAQTAQANPLTICKLGQCAPAEMSLNAEQLYHYVDAFFEANIGQSITFCQANPMTKLCYQPAITLSATSSVIQSDIHLSKAVLLDAKKGTNFNTLSTILDMDIEANGTYPSCESVNSIVAVNATDKISITGYPFKCAFTNSSDTVLSLNFDVDYIDFDAAKIGTFYTLNARQAMTGEVSGYAVLTMPHPIVTNFELKNRVAEIVAPVAPIELVSVEQEEVEEPACDLCEKDEIQIQSEIAHRALAEANQAEMIVKEAMERALEKAQQAAKATEEVAEQKALAAELAKQEADTAAQMAEQARMRVSARVAALNGQPACDKQAVEGCSACANGLEQPTCKCKGEKAKSCGCMMDDCPYKKQTEFFST